MRIVITEKITQKDKVFINEIINFNSIGFDIIINIFRKNFVIYTRNDIMARCFMVERINDRKTMTRLPLNVEDALRDYKRNGLLI